MVSVVSILVGVKQFNSEVNIDHYLSSVLHTGGSQEAVLIALSSEVADAKEDLDSFESIYEALSGLRNRRNGIGLLFADKVRDKLFEVADGEGGDGCCVINEHNKLLFLVIENTTGCAGYRDISKANM